MNQHSQNRDVQSRQMHYSPNLTGVLENAMTQRRVLHLEYESREKGQSVREVEPMALMYKDNRKHLIAWCRLRKDYRAFRLDRINLVYLTKEEFLWRPDFNKEKFEASFDALSNQSERGDDY